MKKKIVLMICMLLLLSVGLLSGCTESINEEKSDQIKYKIGMLDEVVYNYMDNEMNLIFNDDTVFNYYSNNDETSVYEDLIGHKIKVRYFDGEWNFKVIDVKIDEVSVGVGTNGYSNEYVMIDCIDEVFIPDDNGTVDIKRIKYDYEIKNDTLMQYEIYDMWCVNNSGYFYFIKNNDDVFYIEDITKTKIDIMGDVNHYYIIYLDKTP